MPPSPEAREEAAAHRRAEGADPEQPEIEQGKRRQGGTDAVAGQHHGGEREQAQHLGAGQAMLAEDLQHVGHERNAAAEQHQADDIERVAVRLAVVRQVAIDEVDTQQADRHVDEEHSAPVEIGDDQAAGDGPDHRADHARHRHEAQDADEVGLVVGARQGHAADRHHHRAAGALQDAEGHQHLDVGREAAQHRAQGEKADGRGEDAPRAEAVGHPATYRNEDGKAQRIARQHRLHAERHHVHRPGDGRYRGVEDGRIERLHEERHRDQPRQPPLDGVAWRSAGCLSHRQFAGLKGSWAHRDSSGPSGSRVGDGRCARLVTGDRLASPAVRRARGEDIAVSLNMHRCRCK